VFICTCASVCKTCTVFNDRMHAVFHIFFLYAVLRRLLLRCGPSDTCSKFVKLSVAIKIKIFAVVSAREVVLVMVVVCWSVACAILESERKIRIRHLQWQAAASVSQRKSKRVRFEFRFYVKCDYNAFTRASGGWEITIPVAASAKSWIKMRAPINASSFWPTSRANKL